MKLKVLFIPTCGSSIMWWRIQSFVESAWRQGLASFQNPFWQADLTHQQPWQSKCCYGHADYDPIEIRRVYGAIASGCNQADAVVFQFPQHEGALDLFRTLKDAFPRLPILTEIDDNIFAVPPYNEAFAQYISGQESRAYVRTQLMDSDGIIVSTPYLQEVYSELNKNIWVIPNSIDFKSWGNLKKHSKPGVRIGWAGGAGHGGDFEEIEPAIRHTIEKHKDARFVFVNGPAKNGIPDGLKGVDRIEHHLRWVPITKYPKLIASLDFDIGIAPLIDSAFNRGKSNIKWLEGGALSYPVIASNVGHFKETVRHGQDGFLANDSAEFEYYLDLLIKDKKTRRSVGVQANERVRQDFNVDLTVKKYISALEEAIELKNAIEPFRVVPVPQVVQTEHLSTEAA